MKKTSNCASFSENSSNVNGSLKSQLGGIQTSRVGYKQFCVGKNEGRHQKIHTPMCHLPGEAGGKLEGRGTHEQGEIVYLDLVGPVSEKISSFRYCSP